MILDELGDERKGEVEVAASLFTGSTFAKNRCSLPSRLRPHESPNSRCGPRRPRQQFRYLQRQHAGDETLDKLAFEVKEAVDSIGRNPRTWSFAPNSPSGSAGANTWISDAGLLLHPLRRCSCYHRIRWPGGSTAVAGPTLTDRFPHFGKIRHKCAIGDCFDRPASTSAALRSNSARVTGSRMGGIDPSMASASCMRCLRGSLIASFLTAARVIAA